MANQVARGTVAMAKRRTGVVLFSLMALLLLEPPGVAAAKDPVKDGGKVVQQMKVEAPMMTEEDQHGYNMPRQYLCDACRAVAAHVNQTLVRRQPPTRRLKEWEYTELFDEVCANDFEGYGIRWVGGKNKLSGPLLKERDEDQVQVGGASIQMGGDNWKKRMGEICRKIVFDSVGEDELYERFRAHGEVHEDVCFSVTGDCSLYPDAVAPQAKKKKEAAAASPSSSAGKKKTSQEGKKEAAAAPAASSSSAGRKKASSEDKKKGAFLPSEKKDPEREAKNKRQLSEAWEKKMKAEGKAPVAAAEKSRGTQVEKKRMKTGSKVPAAAAETSNEDPVDITFFLAELAVQHGVQPKEYTKNRSSQEWEKTIVALAGKIFGRSAGAASTDTAGAAKEGEKDQKDQEWRKHSQEQDDDASAMET